jgi:hypothetical protein
MRTIDHWRRKILMAGATIYLSTGHISAMTIESWQTVTPPPETHSVPLHFKRHNFQAFCYNVSACHIIYNNHNFSPLAADRDPETYISPPPQGEDYKDNWLGRSYIDIPNFPPPAEVSWKSMDGQKHETTIDIAAIFKEELVWHNVSKNDMANFFKGPVAGPPDIFLEVNDRKVNVYITMFIPTKEEQIAGNRFSSFRNDIILVWTHTY